MRIPFCQLHLQASSVSWYSIFTNTVGNCWMIGSPWQSDHLQNSPRHDLILEIVSCVSEHRISYRFRVLLRNYSGMLHRFHGEDQQAQSTFGYSTDEAIKKRRKGQLCIWTRLFKTSFTCYFARSYWFSAFLVLLISFCCCCWIFLIFCHLLLLSVLFSAVLDLGEPGEIDLIS